MLEERVNGNGSKMFGLTNYDIDSNQNIQKPYDRLKELWKNHRIHSHFPVYNNLGWVLMDETKIETYNIPEKSKTTKIILGYVGKGEKDVDDTHKTSNETNVLPSRDLLLLAGLDKESLEKNKKISGKKLVGYEVRDEHQYLLNGIRTIEISAFYEDENGVSSSELIFKKSSSSKYSAS